MTLLDTFVTEREKLKLEVNVAKVRVESLREQLTAAQTLLADTRKALRDFDDDVDLLPAKFQPPKTPAD